MPRFFVDEKDIRDGEIVLTGDDARHISRSLRMTVGDALTVCDTAGREYDCELVAFTDRDVMAKIRSSRVSDAEPPIRTHLFQALPKGDKLDLILQKAVECGAYEISPFVSTYCVARPSDGEEKKRERRERIALEAAKQCGRGRLPRVTRTLTFDEMLTQAGACDAVLFCYEGEGTEPLGKTLSRVRSTPGVRDIAVVVGSEGGFSEEEVRRAIGKGFYPVGLGKRILRTETAPLFVLSILVYEWELRE